MLLSGSAAQAVVTPTVTVNTLSDPTVPSSAIQAHESLTDAITYLDTTSAGGKIVFKSGLSGTINLTSALPVINRAITIDGPGATALKINGGGTAVDSSIFRVASGITGQTAFSGLTLTNGHANYGGAIFALSAVGVYDDRIIGNTAVYSAGAIYATNGNLQVAQSTISGNKAHTGAAIHTVQGSDSSATAFIQNSTLNGNTSTGDFGVIDAQTNLSLESSTVTGNTSGGYGGGIWSDHSISITGSTVVANTARHHSGGGILAAPGSQLSIFDSIVASNSAPTDPDIYNGASSTSVLYSLIGDGVDTHTGLGLGSSDISGSASHRAQPKLGRLADNGGPTKTRMPLPGSPTINRGEAGSIVFADQRGYGRPVTVPGVKRSSGGDGADIGAVEVQIAGDAATSTQKNLHLMLSLGLSSCVSSFDDLPVSFRAKSTKVKRKQSKRSKKHKSVRLKFKSVSFYVDQNTKSSQPPNASTHRATAHPLLPMTKYPHGEHTLTAVVTMTHRRHKHTIKSHAKLRLHFSICAAPLLL